MHIAKQGHQKVKQQLPASIGGSQHLHSQQPSPWWKVPRGAVAEAGIVTVVVVTVFDCCPLIFWFYGDELRASQSFCCIQSRIRMTPRNAAAEEFWRQDSKDLRGLVAAAGGRGITPYPSSSVPRGFLRTTPEGGRWGGAVTVFQKYS